MLATGKLELMGDQSDALLVVPAGSTSEQKQEEEDPRGHTLPSAAAQPYGKCSASIEGEQPKRPATDAAAPVFPPVPLRQPRLVHFNGCSKRPDALQHLNTAFVR